MNPAGRRVYIVPTMFRTRLLALALATASAAVVRPVVAQDPAAPAGAAAQPGPCATPDSLIVAGLQRVPDATVRASVGFQRGQTLTAAMLQQAIRAIYATGQFSDVRLGCVVRPDGTTALRALVRERPLLGEEELTLRLTEAGSDFLVTNGYDEAFGARPLKRAIQRYIEDPLSEKILLGEYAKGDEIEVDVSPEGGKLDFRVLTSTTNA